MSTDKMAEPVITGWLAAYMDWHPRALALGQAEANDAFRAGYVAGYLAAVDAQEATDNEQF